MPPQQILSDDFAARYRATLGALWSRGRSGGSPWAAVRIAEVAFFEDGGLVEWFFSAKDGVLRRKHRTSLSTERLADEMGRRAKGRAGPDDVHALAYFLRGCSVSATPLTRSRLQWLLQGDESRREGLRAIQRFVVPRGEHETVLRVDWRAHIVDLQLRSSRHHTHTHTHTHTRSRADKHIDRLYPFYLSRTQAAAGRLFGCGRDAPRHPLAGAVALAAAAARPSDGGNRGDGPLRLTFGGFAPRHFSNGPSHRGRLQAGGSFGVRWWLAAASRAALGGGASRGGPSAGHTAPSLGACAATAGDGERGSGWRKGGDRGRG